MDTTGLVIAIVFLFVLAWLEHHIGGDKDL